jgi:transposase
VNHAAIDLGSKESQVCLRASDGTILVEKKHPTRRLGELLRSWSPSRVILETSSEAFKVADEAKAAGHEVRVVPATLSKQLGVGERGIKTDERDARKLSEVSCRIDLPSVHVPSVQARELRDLIRSRETLIETRTKLINRVRGWLRTQLGRIRGGGSASLPQRVRSHAESNAQVLPLHIDQTLNVVDVLNTQLRDLDSQVKAIAKANATCRRLMSIPGIGAITAVTFVAALDDVTRFSRAHQVASYLGLSPGENSSSERQLRTGITKAGPSSVRRTLVQAAWVAFRLRPLDPMVRWATQIAERRGKSIAVVALARKMSGVMYALWRDDSSYKPAGPING